MVIATDRPGFDMTKKDLYEVSLETKDSLEAKHEKYEAMEEEWNFLLAAYEGVKSLVEYGAVSRHERESWDNWTRRKDEAYGFGYSGSVIDLFNFYQYKKPIKRQLGPVGDTEEWNLFENDCNREGDDLDSFMMESSKYADIFGHIGIMVNFPKGEFRTLADKKKVNARPYTSLYFPTAILDWEYERDDYGLRHLTYLKLVDDDGYYHLWYQDHWELWEIVEDEKSKQEKAELIDSGPNPLGEIPFVFLFNKKSSVRDIGKSDITDIARIDSSIIRNTSQGEEVINYAAFPMMRKPYKEPGTTEGGDEVGPTAVLGFNPEFPDAKPDWLEAKVKEPIDAILDWIANKVSEVYRSSNAGGMAGTEISTQAKSGVALRAEFQLLNGKLIKKSEGACKAMRAIIRYWFMWEGREFDDEVVKIERPKTFEIENLAADLENTLTSKTIVKSTTFSKELQKMVVRLILPNIDDQLLTEIDEEIEKFKEENPESNLAKLFGQFGGGGPQPPNPEEEEEEGGGVPPKQPSKSPVGAK